jgi:hypothetical protein
MSDLRTLHDAFVELERRADAASAEARSTARPPRRVARLVPMAATIVAVAGLIAGAVWLVPGDSGAPVGGQQTTTVAAPPTSRDPVPKDSDELADRFKEVLGDTGTFSVTETMFGPGPFIFGKLTVAGVDGGFDLQIYNEPDGAERWSCGENPDCQEATLPDGSQLTASQFTHTEAPGGISYTVSLVRPDNTLLLIDLSNRENPKGMGVLYGPQPPLTLEQLKAIVASELWW